MHCLRRFLVLLGFILGLPAAAAAVTTADQLCTGQVAGANPCILRATVTVDVRTRTLDFGSRELRISRSGRLRLVQGDVLTISARSIVLEAGALIDHAAGAVSQGADLTLTTTGDIQLLRSGPSRARIDMSADSQPGGIHLGAGGSIASSGYLFARGTAAGGGEGQVDLTAGVDVTVDGDVDVHAPSGGGGGEFDATAGRRLIMSAGVDASGGDSGGEINLTGGPLVSSTGNLDTHGTDFVGAEGGAVNITGAGDVTLGGKINTAAQGGFDGDSGDGGDVTVDAAGILVDGAAITATGGGEDGNGAEVDLDAGALLRITGDIDVRARGSGGVVSLIGGTVSVEAEINADGGDGGDITLTTARATMVAGRVTVTGKVHAGGGAGSVRLEGCDVSVPTGAQVTAGNTYPGGQVLLQASGQMTIAGKLAASSDGRNLLQYRDAGRPPVTAGADIQPAATLQQVGTLRLCAGPPVCGNNLPEPGEGCDDGNTVACDATHCSHTCQVEVCGNGTPECGEECDDGNTVEGDACDSNCTTPRCGNRIIDGGEQCDDGNTVEGDGCDQNCQFERLPTCTGNGVQPPEQCDDGNDTHCDGCDQCILEACGNGFTECDEECDDHNTEDCDGCSSTCQIEHFCGNGVRDCDEQCDEGAQNGKPGVKCNASCRTCTPGECPCAASTDCGNPRGVCAGFECQDGLCVNTAPLACPDNGCNGVQTCDPVAGCVPGDTPICNDHDDCTVDSCQPDNSCQYLLAPDFTGVTCRVNALDDTVKGAAAGDISRSVQKKLKKIVAKVRAGARKAQNARKARKATKLLAGARNQLAKIGTVVSSAVNAHKLEPGLAARLTAAAGNTAAALDTVSGSLATPK